MFKHLRIDYPGAGVAEVYLNRPPVNAVHYDMYIEIAALFSQPDQIGAGLRAIVLSGTGPHFCAGNDLEEFATMNPENGPERMLRVREAFFAIQDCPVPVIGAIHGAAVGTGLAIAASCDIVVAARDARFGVPELAVGVMGGAKHLSRLAPQHLVRRMFMTGEAMLAEDLAEATGALIVCAPTEVLAKAHEIASRVASFSPLAVRLGKEVLNRIETMDLKSGYELEQSYTVRMSGHPDSKEALSAYRDKRTAVYAAIPSLPPSAD